MKLFTILVALISCLPFFGCGSAQTHHDIELGAYAADDGVCVTEATSKDAGLACIDTYKRLYAPFWPDSGLTVCEVGFDAGTDGGK